MTGVDTNILTRFLVGDDKKQAERVREVFRRAEDKKETFHVPLLVVLELIWVLESVYKTERAEVLDALAELLLMPIFSFENIAALQKFIPDARGSKLDLSDLLIARSAATQGCKKILTFDKKASSHPLFQLV